jgi:hypothetical protein
MSAPKRAQVKKGTGRRQRKRTDTEIQRDRAIVADLHYKGHNDVKITEILNSRPDVEYEISRRMVTHDRNCLLKEWKKEQYEHTDDWVAETIAELEIVKAEAWRSWERSLEERTARRVKERLGAEGDIVSLTEEAISQGTGDTKYLEVVMKCIQERNRLRGLYEAKIAIRSEHKHEVVLKAYQEVSPSSWDVIEGEVVEPKRLNGQPA